MRKYLVLPLVAVLAACSVSKDDKNDSMTVQYDENVAENAGEAIENAAADVGNEAKDIANDVKNVDVDVDAEVKTDGSDAKAN